MPVYNYDEKQLDPMGIDPKRRGIDPKKKYKVDSDTVPKKKIEATPIDQEKNIDGQEWYLDQNHTHFLLVDNGTVNRFNTEIDLRVRLENKIDKLWQNLQCMSLFQSIHLVFNLSGYFG